MSRADPFNLESERQHAASPSLVGEAELVCRGAFSPMHYKKGGRLKPSFIRASELLEGSLSVWRGGITGNDGGFVDAVDRIRAGVPPDNDLEAVFGPAAAEIRDIEIEGKERVFYVVDDCATDDNGGYDQLHAGVKLCPNLGVQTTDDELFSLAKNQLLRVFSAFKRALPTA